MTPKLTARIKAYLYLVPKGSQVVLLGLVIALVVVVFKMADVLQSDSDPTFLFIICLLLLVLIGFLAFVSRKSIDATEAPPITVVTDRAALTLPSGSDPTSKQAELIAKIFNSFRHREELPEADGLIGEKGQPVAGSADDATHRVEEANRAVQEIQQRLLRFRVGTTSATPETLFRKPNDAGDDENT